MTPVAKTGLHCGPSASAACASDLIEVTPVAKTGLHCGNLDQFAAAAQVMA